MLSAKKVSSPSANKSCGMQEQETGHREHGIYTPVKQLAPSLEPKQGKRLVSNAQNPVFI
jgi:hypothetical protein